MVRDCSISDIRHSDDFGSSGNIQQMAERDDWWSETAADGAAAAEETKLGLLDGAAAAAAIGKRKYDQISREPPRGQAISGRLTPLPRRC